MARPFKRIKLKTKMCGTTQTIKVKEQVVTVPDLGYDIRFKNELDGSVDAKVEFFDLGDKGGTAIGGFCDGMTDTVLTVPADDKVNCKPIKSGDYAYEVKADSHADLDPVIIIKPDFTAGGGISPLLPQPQHGFDPFGAGIFAMAASLLVGVLGGMWVGRKMGK